MTAPWDAEAAAREMLAEWDTLPHGSPISPLIARHLTLARATAPSGAEGWRSIASAPKDDLIDILIDGKTRWCDCYYDRICDQWRTSRPSGHLISVPARSVTHWMPPPVAPGAIPASLLAAPSGAEGMLRERLRQVDECLRTGSWAARGDGDFNAYIHHMRRIIAGESKGALPASPAPALGDTPRWTCFHCGESFTNRTLAAEHFGGDERGETLCQLTAEEGGLAAIIRGQENELARYRSEDSDTDRAMHGMIADHALALMREEEKGYEKGLADGRKSALEDVPAEGLEATALLREFVAIAETPAHAGFWPAIAKFAVLTDNVRRFLSRIPAAGKGEGG
jgi:hypothetical protein